MLIEAINNLKDRESSLETRLLPIEKRLKEIAEGNLALLISL